MFSAQQFPSAYSTLSADQMNRMFPGSISWDPMSRMQNVNPMEQLGMNLMAMSQAQMKPMSSFQGASPYQIMQGDDKMARIQEIKRMHQLAMDKFAWGMNPTSLCGMGQLSCGPMSRIQSCGMNPMSGMPRVQSLFSCNPSLGASDIQKRVKIKVNVNQPLISFSDPQFAMKFGHPMWN